MSTWVVVLESILGEGRPLGGDPQSVRTMLDGLSDLAPVALCQPDRCAIQVSMPHPDPEEALVEALRRYRDVVARTALARWELVRIELLTPAELEAGWDAAGEDAEAQEALAAMAVGSDDEHVREAERALRVVTRPEEARRILCRMVRQLGGAVVSARLNDDWTLPVDLSFGVGGPQVAIVEPWTIARIQLEQALPALVDMTRNRLACQAASQLAAGRAGRSAEVGGPRT